MKRFIATVLWDIKLQFRYGFYYVGAFVVVAIITLASQLPSSFNVENLGQLVAFMLLNNLLITTFYFIAGLVLLEKGQHTLESLVVTPLRRGEYLGSKLLTLTGLACLESSLILIAIYGFALNWAWFLLGLSTMSVVYILIGFALIARYNSINAYLFPSILLTLILNLPALDYLGFFSTPFFYLFPTQPALILLKAAFEPLAGWNILYALLASLVWIALGYWFSLRAFQRFIVGA